MSKSKNKFIGAMTDKEKFFMKVSEYSDIIIESHSDFFLKNKELFYEELKDKKNFEAFCLAYGSIVPLGNIANLIDNKNGKDIFDVALHQIKQLREYLDEYIYWLHKTKTNNDDEKSIEIANKP